MFIFSECIQKHTEYDLFLCGDTLCLMASVCSLKRLFMNYNESTHQEYVLTRSDYNLFFGFYSLLFSFLMSWTFFPFTRHRFREFLRLLPFGIDLYFSFNSLSFFFLAIFFLIDKRSISVVDFLLMATAFFLSFFYLILINNCVKNVTWVLIQGQRLMLEQRWKVWSFEENKQKKKTRKSLLPRTNPPKSGTNV